MIYSGYWFWLLVVFSVFCVIVCVSLLSGLRVLYHLLHQLMYMVTVSCSFLVASMMFVFWVIRAMRSPYANFFVILVRGINVVQYWTFSWRLFSFILFQILLNWFLYRRFYCLPKILLRQWNQYVVCILFSYLLFIVLTYLSSK